MTALPIFEILVPCEMSGKPVRTRHHKEWDKYVLKLAGGLTILKPGKGKWVHKTDLYEDRVIPVRIACSQKQMDKIANFTLSHYRQKAVFYYCLGLATTVLGKE